MCILGLGNLVAFDWNDLPVGREFDCKFLKKVKSPHHALPSSPLALHWYVPNSQQITIYLYFQFFLGIWSWGWTLCGSWPFGSGPSARDVVGFHYSPNDWRRVWFRWFFGNWRRAATADPRRTEKQNLERGKKYLFPLLLARSTPYILH